MKKYIAITAVLLLLIVVYVLQEKNAPHKTQTAGYSKFFNDDFSSDKIWKIHFYPAGKHNQGLRIERDKSDTEAWKVISYFNGKGKKTEIQGLLKDLKEMEGEERASGQDLFSDFEITDEASYHLELSDQGDNTLYHLIVGKKGPDYSNGFARFKDQDTIYIIDKNLRSSFGLYQDGNDKDPDQKRWLDLNIITPVKGNITTISLKQNKNEILLSKSDTGEDVAAKAGEENKGGMKRETKWTITSSGENRIIPKTDIDALLSSVSGISGTDLLDPKGIDNYGLKEPKETLVITMKDGQKHTLYLGQQESDKEKRYYLKRDGDDAIFLLPEYMHKNIFEKIREIVAEKSL